MTTPQTYAKANRYLTERRIAIIKRSKTTAIAYVQGDHGNYITGGSDNGWTCTCPAHGTCSHIIAVEALVVQGKLQIAQEDKPRLIGAPAWADPGSNVCSHRFCLLELVWWTNVSVSPPLVPCCDDAWVCVVYKTPA
jgi:hypothetical protein